MLLFHYGDIIITVIKGVVTRLYGKHCDKHFDVVISFNPQQNVLSCILLLSHSTDEESEAFRVQRYRFRKR